MKKQTTSKYSIICSCAGEASCPECSGLRTISIGNITFKDMREGVQYAVNAPFSDDFAFAQVRLKRDADMLTVTFMDRDESGGVSERSTFTGVVFKLALLLALREDGERLKPMCSETEYFIGFLMEDPDVNEYDLDTLAETIGLGVSEAENCGCLRKFDAKWGTTYTSMVTAFPPGEFHVDRAYKALCEQTAMMMLEENVMFTWALRHFEKTYRLFRGYTIMEILTGAVKTIDQLERDVRQLMRPAAPSIHGPDFREIELVEAMKLFTAGIPVYVDWDRLQQVTKGTWCELNVNHLQNGKWYVKERDGGIPPFEATLFQAFEDHFKHPAEEAYSHLVEEAVRLATEVHRMTAEQIKAVKGRARNSAQWG